MNFNKSAKDVTGYRIQYQCLSTKTLCNIHVNRRKKNSVFAWDVEGQVHEMHQEVKFGFFISISAKYLHGTSAEYTGSATCVYAQIHNLTVNTSAFTNLSLAC